jgi:hypothetical protein
LGGNEMVGMFFANIFDAKVINHETEGNGCGDVGETSRGEFGLDIDFHVDVAVDGVGGGL